MPVTTPTADDVSAVPPVLADPIGVTVALVAAIEPDLNPATIADIVAGVAGGRVKQRRLAQALTDRPDMLRDGRSPAPRVVADLLIALRRAGATAISAPVCADCDKPLRSLQRRGQDWYCAPCDRRPEPYWMCGPRRTTRPTATLDHRHHRRANQPRRTAPAAPLRHLACAAPPPRPAQRRRHHPSPVSRGQTQHPGRRYPARPARRARPHPRHRPAGRPRPLARRRQHPPRGRQLRPLGPPHQTHDARAPRHSLGRSRRADRHRSPLERARLLLHNHTIDTQLRVAGLLVLLCAQQPAAISRLTLDHLHITPDSIRLRLGPEPVVLPEPLAGFVRDLASTRRGHAVIGAPATNPWLFPGRQPGRPISAFQLTKRLRDLGLNPAQSRSTALFDLATELPAAILARMLGIHLSVAAAWQRASAGDWTNYAADIRRRTPGEPP